MSSELAPLDAQIEVITPENVAVYYRAAGPARRALAIAIDIAMLAGLVFVFQWIALLLFAISVGLASGLFFVLLFFAYWFFFGVQEAMFGGRTIGKRILRLRTITVEGHPIDPLQAIMRNLLRAPTFMFPIVDLASMMLSDRFQRVGDLVCGTVVVCEEREWLFGIAKLEDARAAQLAAFIPIDFEVPKTLAKALATYVERRKFFSTPRRREVARHLGAILLERFQLPPDTSHDLLLCALYYRTFVADHGDDGEHPEAFQKSENPFSPPGATPIFTGYDSLGRPNMEAPSSPFTIKT